MCVLFFFSFLFQSRGRRKWRRRKRERRGLRGSNCTTPLIARRKIGLASFIWAWNRAPRHRAHFWKIASDGRLAWLSKKPLFFYCYVTAWFWEQTKYSANTFMHRSLNIIRHSCRPQCFFSLQYTENLWMHFPILFYVGRTALNIWMEFVPGYVSVHSSERTHTQSIVSILFIGLHFLQGQIFHETPTFGNVHIRHLKKSPHSFSLSSSTRRVVSRKISYMAAFSKAFSELRNQSGRTLSVRRSLEMYEVAKK